MLEEINRAKDLQKLDYKEKELLAGEIREFLIKNISKTGGHLSSNLGVVELTIALHSCLDVPKDKIVWDVGHQAYTHKILTGRKDKFHTLRQNGGISGFPNTHESKLDCFNTGHSSTSISVALGMARARDILKEKYVVTAVIGDGALTGGMALEALNDLGASKTDMVVILNDNEMSISKNVGGLTDLLSKLRMKKLYTATNDIIKKGTKQIPVVGKGIVKVVQKTKRMIKQLFISKMFFEDIGFTYLGPVDGHDIKKLESIISKSKDIKGPILIHVITKKGKGYGFAEDRPNEFHSIGKFDIQTGKLLSKKEKDYSQVLGDKLIDLARKDQKIVAITAAMKEGTGLNEFEKQFPKRFYDVGIAEQHSIGLAAGLAKSGLKPVVPIYSSFLQRGYDQIIHDVCIQKLPVILCVDRAGVVGTDGETHQGIFDLSFLNTIPNLNILAPKDYMELEQMLEFAIDLNRPTAIRYPRGIQGKIKFDKHPEVLLGRGEIIKKGKDITIIAIGKMVNTAYEVAEELMKDDIEAEVINARFLKPLDEDLIINSVIKTKRIVTIEDNIKIGGLYTTVSDVLQKHQLSNYLLYGFAYPDQFILHATVQEIEQMYHIDKREIANKLR